MDSLLNVLILELKIYFYGRSKFGQCDEVKICAPFQVLHGKRSLGGSNSVVVMLLACDASSTGFDSRYRRYDFRDWFSPASKSRDDLNIAKLM